MANLVDYMLDLYRNPNAAQAFIDNPSNALTDAGFADVTPAQLQAVAEAAAPANVALGGGDPVAALQQAVAEIHGAAPGGESLLLPFFEVDLDETPEPASTEPTTIDLPPEPTDIEPTTIDLPPEPTDIETETIQPAPEPTDIETETIQPAPEPTEPPPAYEPPGDGYPPPAYEPPGGGYDIIG